MLTISLRKNAWLPLDEIWEVLLEENPKISRSSVHRTFKRENINKVPVEQKEKAKQFKEYEPGYLHIDVTYLPKFNGKPRYLIVAIDRCTRAIIYWIYEQKTDENTVDFLDRCLNFFPFEVKHILTDNGPEFTNRLLKSKKGEPRNKESKMDLKFKENDVQHRLTAPFALKTNGMVERVNGIIKTNTILKNKYENSQEMNEDLARFVSFYNLFKRHGVHSEKS